MALSIDNITWPIAAIMIAVIIAIALALIFYFKYKKTSSRPDPFYRIMFVSILAIFIIVLMDFLDILPPEGGSWLKEDFSFGLPHWTIFLLILLIAGIAAYMYYRTIKPLPMNKLLALAEEHVTLLGDDIRIIDHSEGGSGYPFHFIKMFNQTGTNNNGSSNSITEMLLHLKNEDTVLVTLNTYTGEVLGIERNRLDERENNIRKKTPQAPGSYTSTQVSQGISGLQESQQEKDNNGENS